MSTITKRFNRYVLLLCALSGSAVGALAYTPSVAAAQPEVECFVCACQGGRCICEQVVCP